MNLFCKHEWKILATTYEPEYWEYIDPGGLWTTMIKQKFGDLTTVLLKCKKCPKTKKEIMDGHVE